VSAVKIDDAEAEIRRRLAAAPLTLGRAVEQMLAFYRDVRMDECVLEDHGDMLLFQWGTYDWGEGLRFEVDVVRQFLVHEGEEDGISQLHVTFRFAPDDATKALGAANRWCAHPAKLPELQAFIEQSPAFRAVATRADASAEVLYECV
jgi:hypothetical protein